MFGLNFRSITLLLGICFILPGAFAGDLTGDFHQIYDAHQAFSSEEQSALQNYDIYLVPGILSESFLAEDRRSTVSFVRYMGEYFGTQLDLLIKKYGLNVQRIACSSETVDEINTNIREALEKSRQSNRRVIFMTHSMGGLALLDVLIKEPKLQNSIGGIIFLQGPFYGSTIADVVVGQTKFIREGINSLLPLFNISEATVRYLTTFTRVKYMVQERNAIARLLKKVPVLTVGGVANGSFTLFSPTINIMTFGCINVVLGHCVTPSVLRGPLDVSDGLVGLGSSRLENADYVRLDETDHGELVLRVPFGSYDKARTTETLFKMLIKKM